MAAPIRHESPLMRALAQLTPVAVVVVSTAIVGVASGLVTTKVSLELETQKATVNAVRLVVTGYPVGFILGCLTIRRIVSRTGHGRAFLGLVAALTLITLTFVATGNPFAWFLLRIGSGFGMASIFTIVESWITLYSRRDNRGALLSFYMILDTLGSATGPALIGLSLSAGTGAMYVSAVLFVLGALPLALSGRMMPPQAQDDGTPRIDRSLALRTLLTAVPAAVAAALQAGMTNITFGVMAPIYATPSGFGPAEAGALVSVFSLGGLVAQGLVGWFSDRFLRDKVLAVVAVSAAVTCGLIVTLAPLSPVLPFVLVFVFGCTTLSIYPLAVAFASARVEATYLVSLSSRLLLIYGVGAIVAPALTNELMVRFGPSALFVVLGLATFTVGSISALSNFISARKEMH
jgi:MFS family permease